MNLKKIKDTQPTMQQPTGYPAAPQTSSAQGAGLGGTGKATGYNNQAWQELADKAYAGTQVSYLDPTGAQQQGWLLNGQTYKDKMGTQRIDPGSKVTAPNGNTYLMTPNGGQLYASANQVDANGNWIPQGNPWYQQAQDIWQKIQNRGPFEFDLANNPAYQAMREQYAHLGQRAMEDTMGQAAGLTGGYGSSYAQGVGQQAYGEYLQRLNDAVPELYAQEWQRYQQEGDELYRGMNTARDLYRDAYNEWADQRAFDYQKENTDWERQHQLEREGVDDAWREKTWDADRADTLWSQQHTTDREAVADAQQAKENDWYEREWGAKQESEAYNRQDNERDYLTSLIVNYGYQPTSEELAAAGMSPAMASFLRNQWLAMGGGSYGGGGGSESTIRPQPRQQDDDDDDAPVPPPTNGATSVPTGTLQTLAAKYASGGESAIARDMSALQEQGYNVNAAWDWIRENYKYYVPRTTVNNGQVGTLPTKPSNMTR